MTAVLKTLVTFNVSNGIYPYVFAVSTCETN